MIINFSTNFFRFFQDLHFRICQPTSGNFAGRGEPCHDPKEEDRKDLPRWDRNQEPWLDRRLGRKRRQWRPPRWKFWTRTSWWQLKMWTKSSKMTFRSNGTLFLCKVKNWEKQCSAIIILMMQWKLFMYLLFNMSFGLFANFHIRLKLSSFSFWLTVCEKINFYE